MANANKDNGVNIRLIAAFASILIIVVVGSALFFISENSNKTGTTGGSIVSPTEKKATPTPSPTATPLAQPLFFDDFTDTSKGWYLGNVSGYKRVITNNTLILADVNHNILTESLPTNTIFDDFKITLTFTLLKANADDSAGLYLRGDSNLDHDYRIDIYGNSTYAISKEYLDASKYPQIQFLVTPSRAVVLKPVGQQNTLTVMMKGAKLVLLVNGVVINAVTDTNYTSGQIALFVQNSATSSGVEASFSKVIVYPAS